jgi:AcrR family transcriptional regulator
MSTEFDITPLTPAGERLLDAAAELFYRRGIRAVGVDLIADVAGTTKKTLYDRFGSKDALVALYLRRRAQRWQVFVREYVERTPPGPAQLLAVFDALRAWLAEQDRGCAFVNAHAEIGGTDHPGVPVIRAEKAAMRALFTELAVAAGVDGPGNLAAQLHLLYEGANVAVTAGGLADGIEQARRAATRLLEG